jgi:hypothetical protein
MIMITAQDSVGLSDPHNGVIKAWMQPDEPDNAQPRDYTTCTPIATIISNYNSYKVPTRRGRSTSLFGRGVGDTRWVGRGDCPGKTAMYGPATGPNTVYTQGASIAAFDDQ